MYQNKGDNMYGQAAEAFTTGFFDSGKKKETKEDNNKGSLDEGLPSLKPVSTAFMDSFLKGMEKDEVTLKTDGDQPKGMYTGNTPGSVKAGKVSPGDSNYRNTLPILDAIAKNEGTYDTGYNTEYNYGRYSGGRNTKFRDMTIADVMKHQDTMKTHQKGNRLVSTAVGRYQMLQGTLGEEAKKAGIDINSTNFTPEIQDKLIMNRLKRMRGYDKWKAGTLSTDDFKRNLSKEFASVQNPHTGKGWYPGQNAKPINLVGGKAKSAVKKNEVTAPTTVIDHPSEKFKAVKTPLEMTEAERKAVATNDDYNSPRILWDNDKTARFYSTYGAPWDEA